MPYPGAFVMGLVLFVVGLHVIRIPDRAYRTEVASAEGGTTRKGRQTSAGMSHVKLEGAILGIVGLLVMIGAAGL